MVFAVNSVEASSLSAPTILSIDDNFSEESNSALMIKGLTKANTEVDIYIDNIYQGAAIVNNENGETDNFYFSVKINLAIGSHYISAVAWDKDFRENSGHSQVYVYEISNPAAPTLLIPNEESVVSKVKPKIIGLSESATFVHFYIDGIYNGKTEVLQHESGTANFVYIPFLNLSRERHIVWAVAEDGLGRKSGISNILRFEVEEAAISPTLFNPVVNKNSSYDQPFIVGVVKNDHKVQVYIDKKLNGEIYPMADSKGTTNFAYKPFLKLKPGKHIIYAVAIDSRGKESLWSNIIHYNIAEPRISETAVEEVLVKSVEYSEEKQTEDLAETKKVVKEISKIQDKVSSSSLRNTQANKTDSEKIDIDEIINIDTDKASVTGSVNENEEKQNKLQANIAVFSLFLVAVIAWIFWVNRELIKEKQKEEQKENAASREK